MHKYFVACVLLLLGLASCSGGPGEGGCTLIPLATWEDGSASLEFRPGNSTMDLDVVENPSPDAVNSTSRCMRYVAGGGHGEYIWSLPWGRNFDFTANPPVFRMKVLAPRPGLRIHMKLEPVNLRGPVRPVTVRSVVSKDCGRWEQLEFDFSEFAPESNVYSKIVLSFNAGRSGLDQVWYFDEIEGPSDDLTPVSLFRPYPGNPVFAPQGRNNWRDAHIANAGILSPEESPTGEWMLYCRGSGSIPDYHDQIGLFTQSADDFHPFGPWKEYPGNPVIKYTEGGWDDYLLLDTAPVVGPDGTVYVYYKGRSHKMDSHVGVAWSDDGGYTFHKTGRPWMSTPEGMASAVYHDGRFFIFCGPRLHISDDPLDGNASQHYTTITPGGAPSHFDDHSLWGTFVWRLKGVDKWFMTYQGSARQNDFPDRFHVALSDDLIHWTKVRNPRPLYGRGPAGSWDQGGIWCPEVFEYKDSLYMYYEGWGVDDKVYDRNTAYFEGHSSIGAASCSKADFLEWCGLK